MLHLSKKFLRHLKFLRTNNRRVSMRLPLALLKRKIKQNTALEKLGQPLALELEVKMMLTYDCTLLLLN